MGSHDQRENPQDTFDPVVFIQDGASQRLAKSSEFPFLYNDGGYGRQLTEPKGKPIAIEPLDPGLLRGAHYPNIGMEEKTVESDSGQFYTITLFDFKVKEVHYQALEATHTNARAFGMTLFQSGECVPFPYDNLVMSEYTYGRWAAYESPYLGRTPLGKSRSRELLTINPTDLEYHAFPHVFFSQDSEELVITVARWRPRLNEIYLADLWVPKGSALILPPKFPPSPHSGTSNEDPRRVVVDLHGNRNSAQACRFIDGKLTLKTTTILANDETIVAPAMKPRYHQEKTATHHYHPTKPPG